MRDPDQEEWHQSRMSKRRSIIVNEHLMEELLANAATTEHELMHKRLSHTYNNELLAAELENFVPAASMEQENPYPAKGDGSMFSGPEGPGLPPPPADMGAPPPIPVIITDTDLIRQELIQAKNQHRTVWIRYEGGNMPGSVQEILPYAIGVKLAVYHGTTLYKYDFLKISGLSRTPFS